MLPILPSPRFFPKPSRRPPAASPGRSAPAADGARRWGPDQDEREDDQPVPWFGIDGPRHGDFQEEDDPYGSSWPDGSAAPVPRGPDVADSDADDGAFEDEDDDDEEGDAG